MNPERKKIIDKWFSETDQLNEDEKRAVIEYYDRKDSATIKEGRVIIPDMWANENVFRIHRRRIIPIRCPKCNNMNEFLCDEVIKRKTIVGGFGIVSGTVNSGYSKINLDGQVTCCKCGNRFFPYNGPLAWDMDEKVITGRKDVERYLKKKKRKEEEMMVKLHEDV